ncbi:FxLYD domain-containing protein [Streptomyces sp. NPDC004291]
MSNQEPPPGWGHPPPGAPGGPPPRRKGRTGKVIGFSCLGVVVLIVAILALTLASGGGDDEPERTATPSPVRESREEDGPRGDVKIEACAVDPSTKWPSAELLITNRSSKASTYFVNVEFVDASNKRLDEAVVSSSAVAPGQEAKVKAQGLNQITSEITCRITDVTRLAS